MKTVIQEYAEKLVKVQSLNHYLAWHRKNVKEKDLGVGFAYPTPSILNACPPLFQQICKVPPNLSSHWHRHREHTSMINGLLHSRSWLHCSRQWEIWLPLIRYWHKCQCSKTHNIILNQGSLSSLLFLFASSPSISCCSVYFPNTPDWNYLGTI